MNTIERIFIDELKNYDRHVTADEKRHIHEVRRSIENYLEGRRLQQELNDFYDVCDGSGLIDQ